MRPRSFVAVAVAVLALVASVAPAIAQPRAGLRIEEDAYAGLPFVLTLIVEGLAEQPVPAQPTLTVPGATVTPLGAQPRVSRGVVIVNGRRTASTEVTWLFQWRVQVPTAGAATIPALTVVQDGTKVTAPGAQLEVAELPTTDHMRLEVALPDRPVWVGEQIPVSVDWLIRLDPRNQVFTIPLLAMEDAFVISAPPPTDKRQAIAFAAGARELVVGFTRDDVQRGGQEYARIRSTFTVTPKKAGTLAIPGATVVADLPVGRADVFNNRSLRKFRVSDTDRTLEVKPLPIASRPASFAGAVGSSYSIAVQASRSVVSLGEPVDLDITIRGDALDALSLGRLAGEGGLPADRFAVPTEPPVGALAADGSAKTFRVPVQVVGPATEIPALAFSYFDPVKATYQTIHSQPIALSVKGGALVGAGDVSSGARVAPTTPAAAAVPVAGLSLVGADLALSAPGDAGDGPLGGGLLWGLVGALYAVPLGLLAVRGWRRRTRVRRGEAGEVRAARRRVDDELTRAATAPARDTAGALVAALRSLARAAGREGATDLDDDGLYARLETEAFAPAAAAAPLAAALRDEARTVADAWVARARRRDRAGAGTTAALVLLAMTGLAPAAHAGSIEEGRAAYADAMAATDPGARRADFAAAAAAFASAVATDPARPDLLADWGNAALGAGDVATATLAYRRALALDGSNARAAKNLGWLRSRQPEGMRAASAGATDALLFFHPWPRARRLLVGALAFALAVLLLLPGRRGLRALALLPAAVWLAMTASVLLEREHGDDAVVVESVVLRAADSTGAPAALGQPLPAGVEVAILERRDAWIRIRLAGGTTGWVPAGAVTRVAV